MVRKNQMKNIIMVKIKVYRRSNAANKKYWYLNWSTYDVKKASKNKRAEWMLKNAFDYIPCMLNKIQNN